MYLATVLGNLIIILATISDSHLHMPMYFFLSNLSFVDICFISTTVPKMLVNIQTRSKAITYKSCVTQMYFFLLFAGLDIILLIIMAYDRFVAICHPLHFPVIMNPRVFSLSLGSQMDHMEQGNGTQISEFLLLGFSEEPGLQPFLLGLFLSMYLITTFGKLLIICAITLDSKLHTPMYFFLINLSFSDIFLTSTTVPKMLVNMQTQSKVMSFEGCLMQLHFFIVFASLENFLLAVMAYDCFVAICCPLHYTVIMNPPRCVLMVVVSWILSLLHAFLQSLMVLRLSFYTDLEIPHFFCELNQVVQLACSDTFPNDLVMYVTFTPTPR
ncbi:Olfactory receptor 7A5 [Sciurus carolinensis]|uniref:Olfactory receptor 7A5 n=1 Tax=Sciurus carolinensis TaxID=30640 RepID=A0AA41MWV5_SCICA|nr:Olfactory receptor 7A5 [Sciurus carolinensis]